jgi:hypothetical protein
VASRVVASADDSTLAFFHPAHCLYRPNNYFPYNKDGAHADEYKVIMPAGKENLCLTAQDEGQVSLSSCSKSEVSESQKWNWWANSDRDEAWAKAVVRQLDNCLDAKSGNVQTYKCKSQGSVDRHNQLWQFGKTPTHH